MRSIYGQLNASPSPSALLPRFFRAPQGGRDTSRVRRELLRGAKTELNLAQTCCPARRRKPRSATISSAAAPPPLASQSGRGLTVQAVNSVTGSRLNEFNTRRGTHRGDYGTFGDRSCVSSSSTRAQVAGGQALHPPSTACAIIHCGAVLPSIGGAAATAIPSSPALSPLTSTRQGPDGRAMKPADCRRVIDSEPERSFATVGDGTIGVPEMADPRSSRDS